MTENTLCQCQQGVVQSLGKHPYPTDLVLLCLQRVELLLVRRQDSPLKIHTKRPAWRFDGARSAGTEAPGGGTSHKNNSRMLRAWASSAGSVAPTAEPRPPVKNTNSNINVRILHLAWGAQGLRGWWQDHHGSHKHRQIVVVETDHDRAYPPHHGCGDHDEGGCPLLSQRLHCLVCGSG